MYYQHAIDPVALAIGPVSVHWYGIMYLVSFLLILWYGHWRIRHLPFIPWTQKQWADSLVWFIIGVIVGGRTGYVLFYGFDEFVNNPLSVFFVWQGGMSFHGGLIGVVSAMLLYERKHGKKLFQLCDFVAPMAPIGLFFGRIGNFIGGELWGKPTDLPWAVIFPASDMQPRHPSQLYEVLLEGLLLFVVLNLFVRKVRPRFVASGIFMAGYGLCRIAVEFVREPDSHLGYLAFDFVTMGQILSLPMVAVGVALVITGYRLQEPIIQNTTSSQLSAKQNNHTSRKKLKKRSKRGKR